MQPLANRASLSFIARRTAARMFALALACAGADACAYDWQVETAPAGHLFPALELSQAPRTSMSVTGGGDGLVSVRIRGNDIPRSLRLRIDTPGLRKPAIVDLATAAHAGSLVLHPRLDWDVAALRRLGGTRPQILHATLEGPGHVREARNLEVRLHPLDDALYFVREGKDRVDLGWAFAGYVNPRDAVVDDVLALAHDIDPDFDAGGGRRDPTVDLRRVAVIWAALERRGLHYADGDPSLSRGPAIWSQRVRLLGDVWRERRASCIDSSVLIASVLERIGLHPFIVLVPGHAFVGYGNDRRDVVTLETTLLGTSRPRAGGGASSFADARAAGRARWRKVAAKLDGHHGPEYALVDIGIARAYGIIPLAVDSADLDDGGVEKHPGNPVR